MSDTTSLPKITDDLFRSAFDFASIGKALVGTDGTWLEVNDSVCRILGYSKTDLLKITFQDITHPDDLHKDLTFLRQLLAGEINSYEMEKRYFHKNGNVVWALLTVSLVRNEDQSPRFFISQIQDISEKKLLEQQLRQHRSELRSILENTQILIARIDRESRHLYINAACEREIGIPASVLTGKTYADLGIKNPETELLDASIAKSFSGKKSFQIEHDNHFVTDIRHYCTYFTPEFNENGEVETVLVVTINITDLKNNEMELRQALAEIQNLQEILPICSYCKNIRDDKDYWHTVENYISSNTNTKFSHSVCPDCYEALVKPQLKKLKNKR